jgi:ubiquinone/menaquinone biosynthesis C-methylase UbiE
VALDFSQNMLQKLYLSLRDKRPQLLGAVRALGTATCFRGEQFDLILCAGVLQYQRDEELLIKEISRLLKRGGFCIFTLPNLLSVNHLTDPIYYVRSLRRLWARCLLRKEEYASNSGWFRFFGPRGDSRVYNKQYMSWEVSRRIQKYGLALQESVGLGYGPLTFGEREILPESWSILLSDQLTALSRKSFLRWLRYCANRWVFAAQRI